MVFHSRLGALASGAPSACSLPLMPIRNSTDNSKDIVDEAIDLYRANCLFRSFNVDGSADKLLIYLQLYIGQCLKRVADVGCRREAAQKLLYEQACDRFSIPGDGGWVLGGLTTPPSSKDEAESIRLYLRQCRQEIGRRLVERCFLRDGSPNKFWLAFANRRLLSKSL